MSREVMQQAFSELQNARDYIYLLAESKQPLTEEEMLNQINAAITALRQALETERNDLAKVGEVGVWGDIKPVAWMHTTAAGLVYFRKKPQDKVFNPQPVYTAPPKKEWVGLTKREVELIDEMIETQLLHAERCDHMANSTMAQKQKAWDLERVELLRKLKERNQ